MVTADRQIALNHDTTRFGPNDSFRSVVTSFNQIENVDLRGLHSQAFNLWIDDMTGLLTSTLVNRSLFVSQTGMVGLAPEWTKTGDLVCILFGCNVPVILREQDDNYVFIGERYVL
jgi:hypothetical protein